MTPSIAIVGAGVCGLACADRLRAAGLSATLFDKGKRVGGRLASRGTTHGRFDHGAQFLGGRSSEFLGEVKRWAEAGTARPWVLRIRRPDGKIDETERWVGDVHNRTIAEHLASNLRVKLDTEVAPIEPGAALRDAQGNMLGQFDLVVVTAPLAQARTIVGAHDALRRVLASGQHDPCWALMLAFERPLELGFDAWTDDGPIAWAAREASKPGRLKSTQWIVHASAKWSRAHLELSAPEIVPLLLERCGEAFGPLPPIAFAQSHRWRYARVSQAIEESWVGDRAAGVFVAGDGLLGSRVEAAWVSGRRVAEEIIDLAAAPTR